MSANGIFYGAVFNYTVEDNVWAYDESGNLIGIYDVVEGLGDLVSGQMVVSGDDTRLISLVGRSIYGPGSYINIVSTN